MLQSQLFTKTKKEFATGEESTNAKLLIKASFVDKVMAGVYTFLPLGLRVLNKIENIIRHEMDNIGGQEILMPTLQPKENWEKTNRWDSLDVLFKTKGVGEKDYALGATHEEIVTPLAQQFIFSYKDLPLGIYQIQTKFRNEPRAKAGLMRGREFRMKDLYSFHANQEDFEKYYEIIAKAYEKIWDKLGIGDITHRVLASGGTFSKYSDEYQTICENGEDTLFKSTDVIYNKEIAPSKAPEFKQDEQKMPLEEVEGKGIIGVEKLCKFLKIPIEKTTKTILFENEKGEVIAGAVRGDYEINEIKLCEVSGSKQLKLASKDVVKKVTNAEVGYAGILNLPAEVKVYMDDSIQNRINFETGANKTDRHTINVNFGRDIEKPKQFYDIKIAQINDIDPKTGKTYQTMKASEVGNIFPLKTKYSDAFNLKYNDESGTLQPVQMGCYGIGPSRVLGVIVEIFHDDRGILWPENIAPFKYHLINLSQDEKLKKQAKTIYQKLLAKGEEILFDDREEFSPGEKLKDSDLIGIPYRLIISDKTNGKIELKKRNEKDVKLIDPSEL